MKKYNVFFTIVTFFLALTITGCSNEESYKDKYGFYIGYDEVVTAAEKSKKDILVLITSDEQTPDNQNLLNIISSEDYSTVIGNNYETYHIDFSDEMYSQASNDEDVETIMNENYQMLTLLDVKQFPEIYIFTKEGYCVTGVDNFYNCSNVKELSLVLDSYSEIVGNYNSMVAKTKKGSAVKRVEAIDALYENTVSQYRNFLNPLVVKVPEIDKRNKAGLSSKYLVISAEIQALNVYLSGDISSAIEIYFTIADKPIVKLLDKQLLFYKAAILLGASGATDTETVISFLESAYNLYPQSSLAKEIQACMDEYQKELDAEEAEEAEVTVDAK